MAISATSLTASSSSTTGTSFSTASITPTANRLILCAVASRRADSIQPLSPTVTGCGVTWVQVIGLDYDTSVATLKRLTVYRALGTPTTGALTFDFGANNQTTCEWCVDEFAGIDTGGTNGSAAIVQSASQAYQPVAADPFSVTLAAFANVNNATYGVSVSDRGTAQTVGAAFTQISSSGVSAVGAMSMMSEFNSGNQTTVDFNAGATGNNAGVIGIELAAGSAASIVQQPGSVRITDGDKAYLQIVATGVTNYQWQDNRTGSFANTTDGTGATTANLVTPALTTAATGRQYRCVIDGTLNSSAATVTVDTKYPTSISNPVGTFDPALRAEAWF